MKRIFNSLVLMIVTGLLIACQGLENTDRTGDGNPIVIDPGPRAVWTEFVSTTQLYDELLQGALSLAAIEYSLDSSPTKRPIAGADDCLQATIDRQTPVLTIPVTGPVPSVLWSLDTQYNDCNGSTGQAFVNGLQQISLSMTTTSTAYSVELADYAVTTVASSNQYDGYLTMVNDGVDFTYQMQVTRQAKNNGALQEEAGVSVFIKASRLNDNQIVSTISGFVRRNVNYGLVGTDLVYDTTACPLQLVNAETDETFFQPGFPINFLSGRIELTDIDAGTIYTWEIVNCVLREFTDGELVATVDPTTVPDDNGLLLIPSGFGGMIPARFGQLLNRLSLPAMLLQSQDWCDLDDNLCRRFSYDVVVDTVGSRFLRSGTITRYDDNDDIIDLGIYGYESTYYETITTTTEVSATTADAITLDVSGTQIELDRLYVNHGTTTSLWTAQSPADHEINP